MASIEPGKSRGKGGAAKNPKRCKREDEEEEDLKELLEDPQDKPRWKTTTIYSKLTTSEFITKGEDCKARLAERLAAAAAKRKPDNDSDNDDDDVDKTEKERLEHETKELESQLKKVEKQQAALWDKEEKEKVVRVSKRMQ